MLDAFGPDLAKWPSPAADAAVALMADSQAAQDLFAARTADQSAREDAAAEPPAELVAKILKTPRS